MRLAAPSPARASSRPGWSIRLETRQTISAGLSALNLTLALVLALAVSAVFLAMAGQSPLRVYATMLKGAFGSAFGLSETLVRTTPLLLCGLGVALASRMQLWNVGAEGQFHWGAIAATWVVMKWPEWPAVALLPTMAVASAAAGAAWALLPGAARAFVGTNEIITTLLMNYVAVNAMLYLVYGPWKDPASVGFPFTPIFPDAATIPPLWGRVHAGLVVAIVLAVLVHQLLWRTRWGYEVRVIGESPLAARYAGIPIQRNILAVFALAGALAGLAGMMEVSGLIHRLQRDISPGYGYSAIIIAYLARLHPLSLILVSVLFAGMQVGGFSMQTLGIPVSSVYLVQGTILFCILAAEFLSRHRVRWVRPEEGA